MIPLWRIFLILLTLAALNACDSPAVTPIPTPDLQSVPAQLEHQYVSTHGISVHYPDGWKTEEHETHIILTDQVNTLIGGSLFIPSHQQLEHLGTAPTPHEIMEQIVIAHGQETGLKPEEIEHFTVEGKAAVSFYYSEDIDEMYMVMELGQGQFAILTFAAPPQHLTHFAPTAREILASVKYLP